MLRTLIISDLHLGSGSRVSVLDRPEALERLLSEVERADRLVLLGDIVELLEGRATAALSRAESVLGAVGSRLGPEAEAILVPGNHDRPLIRRWLRSRGANLGLEDRVPLDASPALSAIAERLGPGRLQVRYPGVRLNDSVWATHGHYLDRHLVPVSNWGWFRGRRAGGQTDRVGPWRYERSGRLHVSPLMPWLPRPATSRLRELGSVLRATTMPALQEGVLDPRIAPLTWRLLSHQMRRHALPAMAQVVHRLGVEADWVVFGHVHRLGPLAGDDDGQWRDRDGAPGFLNTGAWLYEPRLVAHSQPPHPYWPGGAVVIEDGAAPRPVGLLDELAPAELEASPSDPSTSDGIDRTSPRAHAV
ncbi:MAG TPA: metallophosphoesterase [Solirubrobacteraceae bacterium]|jgi:UDP-2,3-diacylglucosamine pyrophosphatase LpxH|nr:metallophosphoesterase [Solirubrobacteraceae bacterium]